MPNMRRKEIKRATSETKIELDLSLEGQGQAHFDTGLPFWEHMWSQWVKHGGFDLIIKAQGDLQVDEHHLVEDIGLCLGTAFHQSLGDKKGIKRFGSCLLPMDDALIMVAVDLSGRPYLHFEVPLLQKSRGANISTEMVEEFWRAVVNEGRFNLHIKLFHGSNLHHVMEALFKGTGKAMGEAAGLPGGSSEVPSTKGSL